MSAKKPAPVFDQIVEGLQASIAYSQGRLELPVTRLPAPPPRPRPKSIVALRQRYSMSQAVFAATLNVSTKTVQAWEQGLRTPSQASARLLQLLDADARVLGLIYGDTAPARLPRG